MDNIDELIDYAESLSPGELSVDERKILINLLSKSWDELQGSSAEKTTFDKLFRAENLRVDYPMIYFELERHGGLVNGSTRADIHRWEINLEQSKAILRSRTYRQVSSLDKRYNATEAARMVSKNIINGEDHEYLTWDAEKTRVTVILNKIVPSSYSRTTQGRNKRFREELQEMMNNTGWDRVITGNRLVFDKRG